MQDSLLWVYEGQTQYWGNVLTARAGLRSRRAGAGRARAGRRHVCRKPRRPGVARAAGHHQRSDHRHAHAAGLRAAGSCSEDYYSGGQMIWLEADALPAREGERQGVAGRFREEVLRRRTTATSRCNAVHVRGRGGHAQRRGGRRLGHVPARSPRRQGAAHRRHRSRRLEAGLQGQAQCLREGGGGRIRPWRRRLRVFAGPLGRQGQQDRRRALGQPRVQGRHRPRA